MGGVGCHELACSTGEMPLALPGVMVIAVGRVWSIVMAMNTHVGNTLNGLSRNEDENRQVCGKLSRLGKERE
jgi:hypothetical protein